MYNSGFSQVNKFSPEAQKKMQYRTKGKSCGYYMRIIFFFSSLIQSLIIVSLVLFLIYGKTQDTASLTRVQDLEERFSRISIENVALGNQRKNLTNLLNVTLTEKAKNDWDLANLKVLTNRSVAMFQYYEVQLKQYEMELITCRMKPGITPARFSMPAGDCNCGLLVEQMKAGLQLLESNLTQTKQIMTMEKEQIAKERDNLILEAIHLRREKSTLEKELDLYREKSRDQFSQLLAPVSTVSKALLEKIDSLLPRHIAFQLTCPKQKEHLEQIQTNCTSLSREVENKLQRYLDIVGEQVSSMQIDNNRLKAENWRLSDDYRWCSQNRTGMMEQHKRGREDLQLKHDQEKERLLMDKMKLTGEIDVLQKTVKYKDAEVDHLKGQLAQLNMSCMARNGVGGGGLGSRSNTQNQFGRSSFGSSYSSSSSSSSGQGRVGTAGTGSSFSSGSVFNKPSSTGTSSSSSTFQQSGSSQSQSNFGSGVNKPGITNPGLYGLNSGSVGTGLNKPAEDGRSSTPYGSSFGSTGSNLNQGSMGTNFNRPASGSSSVSSGSSSSTSKSSSSPLSWFDSISSGQSKTGSVPGKSSLGSGNGGTSSAFGGGRTNGQGAGSAITQHVQELQRLINPPAPQEKQDLSRVLG